MIQRSRQSWTIANRVIFSLYPDCVYGNKPLVPFDAASLGTGKCMDLIKVYVLADKLQDTVSTNLAIDGIIQLSDHSGKTPSPLGLRSCMLRLASARPRGLDVITTGMMKVIHYATKLRGR